MNEMKKVCVEGRTFELSLKKPIQWVHKIAGERKKTQNK